MTCLRVFLPNILAFFVASGAHAAVFQVTNTNDAGPGSLRDAIAQANASSDLDTIEFVVSGTIVLQSNLPILTESVVIQGSGTETLIIDGNQDFRPFRFGGPVGRSYLMQDLTLRNGFSDDSGGAILVTSNASLSVVRCIIEDSSALTSGGGIAAFGPLQMTDSIVRANQSTFGGGISLEGSGHSIQRSSLLLNSAANGGGVFVTSTAIAEFENVTVAGNSANNDSQTATGGGLIATTGGSVAIRNSTFALNLADFGAGVAFIDASVVAEFANNILDNNRTWSDIPANCSGVTPNNFANLSSDGTCQLFGANDLEFVDPLLDSLEYYGGLTLSFLPKPGSPAVDSAENSLCPTHDQRNRPRPESPDSTCDRGAVEVYPDDDYPEDGIFSDRFGH